jgi:hypothetical protein
VENLGLSQFLSLFSWFVLAGLLFFVLLIARFYQKFSGERTYFFLFGVVIILFGISTVRYTSLRQISGDWVADILSFIGGVMLITLSIRLYTKMMTQNKNKATP